MERNATQLGLFSAPLRAQSLTCSAAPSSDAHSKPEAARLGDTALVRALRSVAAHAEEVLAQLPQLAQLAQSLMNDFGADDLHPGTLVLLVVRVAGVWESSVAEKAQRYGDELGLRFPEKRNSRATVGAEQEIHAIAAVSDMYEGSMLALEVHGRRRETRLGRERTARATLAGKAVADGDANRFTGTPGTQSATSA
jgi:hypothetical protein